MTWLIIVLIIIVILQFCHIRSTARQIREASDILDDVRNGNLNRRILAGKHSGLSPLIYKMNEIIIKDKQTLLDVTRSEKTYKRLVTDLSHDVRTPLASLTGYLEALEHSTLTAGERKRYVTIAAAKALDLSNYIQSLFEWLKLESGEWIYHRETIDICEQTRLILAGWILKLDEHQIRYRFDLPDQAVSFTTDRSAYERIVSNILTNTLKHSRADLLEITLTESEAGLLLRIADNGTGIPAAELPFIFDRLYQHDRSGSKNSSGLGLAITRELVTALGGTITAESGSHQGTVFLLTFPKT